MYARWWGCWREASVHVNCARQNKLVIEEVARCLSECALSVFEMHPWMGLGEPSLRLAVAVARA